MTTREEMRSLAEEIVGSYEDRISGIAELRVAVKTQLKEFDDAHAAMSRELEDDLAKVRPALEKEDRKRQSEAREFMGELGKAVAEGKAATQALLRDFGEEQAGARDEWQKMTATMQAKRGVAVAEVTPEITTLHDRVLEYLASHPDGTRMTELEQEFGVARIQMARLLKDLTAEKKVEKRELLYFAK